MAEWLIERGIGEDRAILVEHDQVLAAKMHWPGELRTGPITAQLVERSMGASRGVARTPDGYDVLVSKLPKDVSEGRDIPVWITRTPIAERGRLKRAAGIHVDEGANRERDLPSDNLLDLPDAKTVRRFPSGLWEDVWSAAWTGEVGFAGGSLLFSVTPAMTLVDIDGDLTPRELALAAVPPLARALRQFDLGGSIGVDFPTLAKKAHRRAVDTALDEALADWPHERTAMNGFGFVQLVARMTGPSLLHRLTHHRAGSAARIILRRAEHIEGTGRTVLVRVHPAVEAQIKLDWRAELARRTGREVRIETDPTLALDSGYAQLVE